ncbi:DUF1906 domain-containing protein [Corynebacterium aquatimens]|uniref:Rv2525c-like glycoside hydrolase-like domain-containing protein n=1 Tax=Corynebacterium aquatimens TaxID=1190508 RepID=A0A931GVB4_9CORY|nr:DUF1906 domain-containing protein [Corynebacterium aquatimens]MBG6121051.1 hypothetical protein [Corynebacterium aquatimens]
MNKNAYSRRGFLKAAGIATAAGTVGLAGAKLVPGAQAAPLGTILDYAVGVPSARSVKNAGHLGAIRYVSNRRPGTESWMTGKPVTLRETKDFAAYGLSTASIYQFGRANTADWLGGAASAAIHAPQAIALHKAAGGPTGRPIYIAIDDNPTIDQYTNQIRPYLRAFQTALFTAGYQAGVYGNYDTIQWCINDGIGTFYWQHDWGSRGRLHPRANIHQVGGLQTTIDGVTCDINRVYNRDWGQWKPGQSGTTLPQPGPGAVKPAPNSTPAPNSQPAPANPLGIPEGSSLPHFTGNPNTFSSEGASYLRSLTPQDLSNAAKFAQQFLK